MADAPGSPRGPKMPPAPGPIPAGVGHCCPHTPHCCHHTHTQGLGCSLPHNHPRDETALQWACPPCGTSAQPSKVQLCTYRKPWEPSRTWVSCSALGKEGCSAVCPWKREPGSWDQGEAGIREIPMSWDHLSSVCAAPGQNPASREWDQGPACSQKGVWDGSMLQAAQGMCCRSHIHAEGSMLPGAQGARRALPGSQEHHGDQGDLAGPGGQEHHQ